MYVNDKAYICIHTYMMYIFLLMQEFESSQKSLSSIGGTQDGLEFKLSKLVNTNEKDRGAI